MTIASNIANVISLTRVVLGLVAGVVLVEFYSPFAVGMALVLVLLAEASDMLDGMAARRLNRVSELGKLLDPLSDSVYRLTIFVAFLELRWVDWWVVLIVALRDILVAYLRAFAQQRQITLQARVSGKIKAISQGAMIIIMLLWHVLPAGLGLEDTLVRFVPYLAVWAAAAVTLWSAVDYWWSTLRRLSSAGAGRRS